MVKRQNMREIKFKVWDKNKKEMISSSGFFDELYIENGIIKLDFNDYVFLQWTGLTDINGKEIYEGCVYVICVDCDNKQQTGVLIWDEKHAKFSTKIINSTIWREDVIIDAYLDQCEVLGNIYENPELL